MRIQPNWWKRIGISLLVIAIVAGFIYGYLRWNGSTVAGTIPKDIQQQLAFSPLVIPQTKNNFKVDSYKYLKTEDGSELLSYVADVKNTKVTVSQYQQPPQFGEIPDYKDKFLSSVIQQTSTVQTSSGVIFIGKSKDGKQIACMLEKGLLILFAPERLLSDSEWRSIGEQMEIYKKS